MNKLGVLVLLVVLFFLGKYAWSYVEEGFAKMNGYQTQVNKDASDYQKRTEAETNRALGNYK